MALPNPYLQQLEPKINYSPIGFDGIAESKAEAKRNLIKAVATFWDVVQKF